IRRTKGPVRPSLLTPLFALHHSPFALHHPPHPALLTPRSNRPPAPPRRRSPRFRPLYLCGLSARSPARALADGGVGRARHLSGAPANGGARGGRDRPR